MKLVTDSISLDELTLMAKKMHHNLVKAVVDVEKNIMMVDAPLHADQEEALLDQDSLQENLWGINLHPSKFGSEDFVEFDSMINIRPSQNNMDRSVNNPAIRKKIIALVNKWVTK